MRLGRRTRNSRSPACRRGIDVPADGQRDGGPGTDIGRILILLQSKKVAGHVSRPLGEHVLPDRHSSLRPPHDPHHSPDAIRNPGRAAERGPHHPALAAAPGLNISPLAASPRRDHAQRPRQRAWRKC